MNTAPDLGGAPADDTAVEDVATAIDLSAYNVSDADGDDPLTLTLAVNRGTIASTDGNGTTDGVTVGGSGTNSMTLQGSAANLNTYLNNTSKITFTTANNDTATATLTVTPNDRTENGTADTVDITIMAVNDEPSVTVGADQSANAATAGVQQTVNSFASMNDDGDPDVVQDVADFIVSEDSDPNNVVSGVDISNAGDLTYTPAAGVTGTATINVQVQDNGGTANGGDNTSQTSQFTISVDTQNPTVTISGVPGVTDGATAFTATFTFNEPVTDFDDAADITATNAAVGAINATSTTVYTAQITPNGGGNVTVDVPANAAVDAANNGNADATEQTATLDADAPTVTIQNAPTNHVGATAFNVSFEFSENVVNFVAGDVTVGGGTLSNFVAVDGNTYTADITPGGAADVTIDISSNVAQDGAGNNNTAATQVTVTDASDTIAPTVTIQNAPTNHDGATVFDVSFEFSENVVNFVAGDVTVGGGTLSNFVAVDGNTYTADITPGGAADVTIDISANVAQDGAGNNNTAATQVTVTDASDTIAPTVRIQNAPAEHDQSTGFAVTFEFSENVVNFVAGDVTVGNGTLSNFVAVDGNTYTATITPTGGNDVTLDVAANVAQDGSGNNNTAATQVTVKSNIVEQTQQQIASFTGNRTSHILGNQPNIGTRLNTTNFTNGGQLGFLGINGNEQSQTFAFSTSKARILNSIQQSNQSALAVVAERRVQQAFAATTRLSGYGQIEKTPEDEQYFSQHQGTTRQLRGTYTAQPMETYSHQVVEDANDAVLAYGQEEEPLLTPSEMVLRAAAVEEAQAASTKSGETESRIGTWDVWMEVYGSRTNANTSTSTLWVGYVGAHYFVQENMIIGVLGQLDWADETNAAAGSSAEGHGWMIGPYIAGKVEGQNLNYEVRAAWGRSDNDISPNGAFTDSFDTTRWMVSGKLLGSMAIDDLTVRPELSVIYWEETQEAYTDSLANLIAENTQTLGEVRFGPSFAKHLDLGEGVFIEPSVGVSGVYNFAVDNNANPHGFALGDNDIRARLDLGLNMRNEEGLLILLTGFYDGIGIDNYESYGGSARVTIPLS